jgi:hypothetical protein
MRQSEKVQSSATGKIKLKESYKQANLTIEELATKAKVSTDIIQRLLGTRKYLNGVEKWAVENIAKALVI